MALGLERRDGAYYCTVKFAGGISYNNSLQQWHGDTFQPEGNFVMKLGFRETRKVFGSDSDVYDVAITKEGASGPSYCVIDTEPPATPEPPAIDELGGLSCTVLRGTYEYKFNFNNHRFIKIYTYGYTDGVDNNDNTPAISGGLCTKIQP